MVPDAPPEESSTVTTASEIIALRSRGFTISEIARSLEMPRSTVHDVLRRCGATRPRGHLRDSAATLRQQGLTISQIAASLGASVRHIRRLLRAKGT